MNKTFKECDCTKTGEIRSGESILAVVAIGAGVTGTVQTVIREGTRTNWVGKVKFSNHPAGPWEDNGSAISITGNGFTSPFTVTAMGYLALVNDTPEATPPLIADFHINIVNPYEESP